MARRARSWLSKEGEGRRREAKKEGKAGRDSKGEAEGKVMHARVVTSAT